MQNEPVVLNGVHGAIFSRASSGDRTLFPIALKRCDHLLYSVSSFTSYDFDVRSPYEHEAIAFVMLACMVLVSISDYPARYAINLGKGLQLS
ncbi:MAG TPA: hypothetical protein V6D11_02330 [Waterburya sp.]